MFHRLQAEELLPLAQLCTEVRLAPEELLFSAGDLGDALYVIVDGAVDIERDGRTVAQLGAGECVGEMAALDWEPRSATVKANGATHLIRLDRGDALDLLADQPNVTRALAAVLVERIRNMRS